MADSLRQKRQSRGGKCPPETLLERLESRPPNLVGRNTSAATMTMTHQCSTLTVDHTLQVQPLPGMKPDSP